MTIHFDTESLRLVIEPPGLLCNRSNRVTVLIDAFICVAVGTILIIIRSHLLLIIDLRGTICITTNLIGVCDEAGEVADDFCSLGKSIVVPLLLLRGDSLLLNSGTEGHRRIADNSVSCLVRRVELVLVVVVRHCGRIIKRLLHV